jgi:antitoxin YobK
MTQLSLAEFRRLHIKKLAETPKLFELESSDCPASERQIHTLERALGVQLPPTYRSFLMEYGGGAFGLTNVFSADPESDYYSLLRNADAIPLIPANFIAFSDDFCGGWYVLGFSGGIADEDVFYWNTDGGLRKTEFANIFEFLAGNAYDGI